MNLIIIIIIIFYFLIIIIIIIIIIMQRLTRHVSVIRLTKAKVKVHDSQTFVPYERPH